MKDRGVGGGGSQRIDGSARWPGLTSHSTALGTSRSCGCGSLESLLRISSSLARISPLLDLLPRAAAALQPLATAAAAARFAAGASSCREVPGHTVSLPRGWRPRTEACALFYRLALGLV